MAAEDPVADDRSAAPADRSLAALRHRIRELATADGRFVVVCARTAVSPVPIDDYRFESRAVAADAAQYAVAYRERLRELDPRTPRSDPVVHEAPAGADPVSLDDVGDEKATPRDA